MLTQSAEMLHHKYQISLKNLFKRAPFGQTSAVTLTHRKRFVSLRTTVSLSLHVKVITRTY